MKVEVTEHEATLKAGPASDGPALELWMAQYAAYLSSLEMFSHVSLDVGSGQGAIRVQYHSKRCRTLAGQVMRDGMARIDERFDWGGPG